MPSAAETATVALRSVREELLEHQLAWLVHGHLDSNRLADLHRRAAVGMHRFYCERIPAYGRLAEECGLLTTADAEAIRAQMTCGEGAFKSYGTALAEGDFQAMTSWLEEIGSHRFELDPGAIGSREDWLRAVAAQGLVLASSSGTSGRPSLVPRDAGSRLLAAAFGTPWLENWLATGLDRYDAALLCSRDGEEEIARFARGIGAAAASEVFLDARGFEPVASWLRERAEAGRPVLVVGTPFPVAGLCAYLGGDGGRIGLGAESRLMLGGGWKSHEGKAIEAGELLGTVEEWLGLGPEQVDEAYSMAECSAAMHRCHSGRFHVPPQLWPMVVDDGLRHLEAPAQGRFAFFDPLSLACSGFFATGDEVWLELDGCECGREGPVLSLLGRREVEEVRGCAAAFRGAGG